MRTGELRAPDPAARCTKVTGCGPWQRRRRTLVGFPGYCHLWQHRACRIPPDRGGYGSAGQGVHRNTADCHGDGGNGKSTFFNTLARVLGDYSTSINPSLLLTGNRGNVGAEVAVLRGVRLALAAETEEGQRLESSTVKRLCSTDRIAANPKYLTPFTFTPSHTLLMFTNFLPRVGSSDKGTWSRLTVLPVQCPSARYCRGAQGLCGGVIHPGRRRGAVLDGRGCPALYRQRLQADPASGCA